MNKNYLIHSERFSLVHFSQPRYVRESALLLTDAYVFLVLSLDLFLDLSLFDDVDFYHDFYHGVYLDLKI